MGGLQREEKVADVCRPDCGGQAQQDPVRVQFNPDSGPVSRGYQDREHAAQCLVCLVAGADIADNAIIDVLERDEPVGRDFAPVLLHLRENMGSKRDALFFFCILPGGALAPDRPCFPCDGKRDRDLFAFP